MSQRSQVANSGSSPIEQCSAAWAAPGRSAVSRPASVRASGGTVHHTAVVRSDCGGQVERLLAEDLAAGLAPHEVGDDLVRHVDLAQREPALAPPAVLPLGDHRDVGDLAGRGGVVDVATLEVGDPLLEVEALDQPGLAAVHVDRTGVGGAVGPTAVDGADHPAGAGLDQLHLAEPPDLMSARSAARRWSVQNHASARRRSSPASASARTRSRAPGAKSARSPGRSGSSWAAAHRCGPST